MQSWIVRLLVRRGSSRTRCPAGVVCEIVTRVLVVGGALALGACGGPQSSGPAQASKSVVVEPAAASTPTPAVGDGGADARADARTDAETPAAESATDKKRVLRVTQVSRDASPFKGQYGTHPCDFDRSYRGTIDKTPLTVLLSPGSASETTLTGAVHYDRAGPELAVHGSRNGTAVRFSERGGGNFDGTCDAATGRVSGKYTLKGKTQSFELWPRPKEWPPLYRALRETVVAPNYPGCAKVQKPDATTTIEIPGDDYDYAVCAPTEPKARRQAMREEGAACVASDLGVRVFGIKNAALVNRALANASSYADLVKGIKKCWSPHSHSAWSWLVSANRELLTVQPLLTEYYYRAAHPMNSTGSGVAIDLTTGREVQLKDVVTNSDKLRDVARSCAWDYFAVEASQKTGEVRAYPPSYPGGCDGAPVGYLMWDCDPSAQHKTGPSWALTNEGVAVLAQGYAHVTAALNGRGPIVSFAALARAGILNTSSSAAHLWKDAKPAPTDAAACTAAYDGDPTLLRWSVVDSGN